MATPEQLAGLKACFIAAKASGHIFPEAAACEAALESGWFASKLYREDNNIFGTKQHVHPIFGTASIPTKEFLNHKWVVVDANWVKYPTLADSFADRMATLKAMAPKYPHYAAALVATNSEDFLLQVSQSWSTDPQRAQKCISILHAHQDVFR
jgi:flagellum-specific peptidoglycan hydrolase FlgJ